MIQALLFDLDGVIVNTIHYHYLAWEHMFNEMGGSISKQSVLIHEGRNSREILPLFLEEAGVTLPEDQFEDFINRKRTYYRSIVSISHYPGVFEVIASFREQGYKTALVTASALKNMEISVDAEKRELFDFIITGDEVKRAKPFPDPYLAAMNHLVLTPQDCIVIENAPLGIESAKNAGMQCVAIETTLGAEYLQEADVIIQDIRELPGLEIIGSLNGEKH
jgi:HAD superfamily hydrolase (TIGR01509 family)